MRHTHARLRVQQVGAIITTFNSVPFQSTHISGGTLMGDDPTTSVANRYGWGVPNLPRSS